MRHAWMLCGLLVLALGCSDEAAPYLKGVHEQQAALEQIVDILAGVKDTESMEAAREKLVDYHDRCELIVHRNKNLPKPGPEVLERMAQEKDKMSRIVNKLQAEVKRVQGLPQGAKFLQEVKIQK